MITMLPMCAQVELQRVQSKAESHKVVAKTALQAKEADLAETSGQLAEALNKVSCNNHAAA